MWITLLDLQLKLFPLVDGVGKAAMAEPPEKEAVPEEKEKSTEEKPKESQEVTEVKEKAVDKAATKEADKKPPPRQEASPVMLAALVLGALALASTIAVAQAASEQGLQRWMASLSEKHVVPPPEVPNNVSLK
eukprot:s1051_g5.t1